MPIPPRAIRAVDAKATEPIRRRMKRAAASTMQQDKKQLGWDLEPAIVAKSELTTRSWRVNRTFISYRRSDSHSFAVRLRNGLQQALGKNLVFLDESGMQAGDSFPAILKHELKTAGSVIVLIGANWAAVRGGGARRLLRRDDWVRHEVGTALRRGVLVLPVLIDEAPVLRRRDLPRELHPLAFTQAVRASDFSMSDLVRQLATRIRRAGIHLRTRQRSKYVGDDRSDPNEDWYEWSVWLDGPKRQLDQVQEVTYHLHRSFEEGREWATCDRGSGFRLEREGYGGFEIRLAVEFRDGRRVTMYHDLLLR